MNVYIISVLHTCRYEDTGKSDVIASQPIAAFTDKQKAIKTMQEYMDKEDGRTAPIYNMYRHGALVSCSLIDEGVEGNMSYHTEVTLKTVAIDVDDEKFDISREVCAAWN